MMMMTRLLLMMLVVYSVPTATRASVVSDLDTLKEVQNALKHARSSVDGLVNLVDTFVTTTTEAAPSTTSADTGTTEAAPSTTEADTATTEAAPSTTEADTATTEAAPSTTSADTATTPYTSTQFTENTTQPMTSTSLSPPTMAPTTTPPTTTVPTTTTTVPTTTTTVPTTTTTVPTTTTTVPTTTTTTVPITTTTVPTTTTTTTVPTTTTTTVPTTTTTTVPTTTTASTTTTAPTTTTTSEQTLISFPASESTSSLEEGAVRGVERVFPLGYANFRRVLRESTLVDGPRRRGALPPLPVSGVHVAVIQRKAESWTATQNSSLTDDKATPNSTDFSETPITTDENSPTTTDENSPTTTDENLPTTTDENSPTTTDENLPTTTDENSSTTTDENSPTTTENQNETSTRPSESPVSSSVGPVEPWWDRVSQHLARMNVLTVQILGGAEDHDHAINLDKEATAVDNLVAEGWEDPTLVLNVTDDNVFLISAVIDHLSNATEYIDDRVQKAKAEETEVVVTIVCLSVLFVVVLVSVVVSLVAPASAKCGLPKSGINNKSDGKRTSIAEPSNFADASYVQHSQLYADPYRDQTTTV